MQSSSFIVNLSRGIKNRLKGITNSSAAKADLNWFKIKYLKHATADVVRTYTYKGKKLFYRKPSELLHGLQEIFVDEIYKLQLGSNPFIIDCGSNIGMSLIYLKEKHPDAEIIAFEPDEENFNLLEKNITSFNLHGIQLFKQAVWVEDTVLTFRSEGTMGSKIDESNVSTLQKVKAVRLKNFLKKQVDFLKIDIEGAEYKVLCDVAEDLHLVKNMFLEYHGKFGQNPELIKIFQIIQSAGFIFYIKEAANIYTHPFYQMRSIELHDYDVQLNIFCVRP